MTSKIPSDLVRVKKCLVGAIWRGSATNHRGKHWTFGQFEEPCLDIACRLIANDSRTSSASGGAKFTDSKSKFKPQQIRKVTNFVTLSHKKGINFKTNIFDIDKNFKISRI